MVWNGEKIDQITFFLSRGPFWGKLFLFFFLLNLRWAKLYSIVYKVYKVHTSWLWSQSGQWLRLCQCYCGGEVCSHFLQFVSENFKKLYWFPIFIQFERFYFGTTILKVYAFFERSNFAQCKQSGNSCIKFATQSIFSKAQLKFQINQESLKTFSHLGLSCSLMPSVTLAHMWLLFALLPIVFFLIRDIDDSARST